MQHQITDKKTARAKRTSTEKTRCAL